MLKALKLGGRLFQASGCSPHPQQLSVSPAAAAFTDVASNWLPSRRKYSVSAGQVYVDRHQNDDEKHASEKMVNEGGGSLNSYHEVKDEVRRGSQHMADKGREALDSTKEGGQQLADKGREMMDKTKEGSQHMAEKGKQAMGELLDGTDSDSDAATGGGQSGMDTIVNHAKKEMNSAKDMMSDMPKKVHDTTVGLKEVGVEAVKAIKRDTSGLVEKTGLKDSSPEDSHRRKDQDKAGGI